MMIYPSEEKSAMPKTLTIRRSFPKDLIIIPLWVFHPDAENGVEIAAQLDTSNDHTCLRQLHTLRLASEWI